MYGNNGIAVVNTDGMMVTNNGKVTVAYFLWRRHLAVAYERMALDAEASAAVFG
jgi:hypothetical protein